MNSKIQKIFNILIFTILLNTIAYSNTIHNKFDKYLGQNISIKGLFVISSKNGSIQSITAGAKLRNAGEEYEKTSNFNIIRNSLKEIQNNKKLLVLANRWSGKKLIAKVVETNNEWIDGSLFNGKDFINCKVKLEITTVYGNDIAKDPIVGWVNVKEDNIKILNQIK